MHLQLKKVILLCLLCSLFFGNLASVSATVDTLPSNRINLPLTDLSKAAWAEQEIREMALRGVVSGYTDGTFRPNQPVTKIDALVMAVRALGLEKEAQRLAAEADPQFYVFAGKGLDWAKGYLRAAYNTGLIQNYMQESNWHDYADRAWMAQLIVRLLDREEEALELPNNFSLSFKDEQQIIPRSRAKYISVAVSHGLLSGYPDRTFRPDVHISRAELAVILSRYFNRYVEDYSLRKVDYATIEEIDLDHLEMLVRTEDLKKYKIHRNAPVFWTKDKQTERRNLSALKKNQSITFLEHDDQILSIEINYEGYGDYDYNYNYNPNYGTEYSVGFISSISNDGQRITFEDLLGKKHTFNTAIDLEITQQGRSLSTRDLRIGDFYIYELTENNQIRKMEYHPGERTTFTGEVVSYVDFLSELHIYHEIEGNYDYERNSKTFYLPQGIKLNVSGRDFVRVFAYGDFVYDAELIKSTYLEGYFREYDEDRHRLTIMDKYGKTHTFDLAPTREMVDKREREERDQKRDVILRVNARGEKKDSMDSLYYNDYLSLSFDAYDQTNNRNPMEVVHIQVLNSLEGTIESASYSTLAVRNEHGVTIRYSFADNPKINVPGMREAKRADLRTHDKISFQVEKGKVQSVSVYERKEEEGTILEVDNGKITITSNYGQRQTYSLSGNTRITWNDDRNLSRSELRSGQEVRLWFDGDTVTEIRLLDEGIVSGLLTDYSRDSVWLSSTKSGRSRFIVDEDKLRISSFSQRGKVDLEDLLNKVVTLSFAEGKVVSIVEEWQEEEEYTVIYIDKEQRSIRVASSDKKHYIYKLPESVRHSGSEYNLDRLSRIISTKQRVKLSIVNDYVVAIE